MLYIKLQNSIIFCLFTICLTHVDSFNQSLLNQFTRKKNANQIIQNKKRMVAMYMYMYGFGSFEHSNKHRCTHRGGNKIIIELNQLKTFPDASYRFPSKYIQDKKVNYHSGYFTCIESQNFNFFERAALDFKTECTFEKICEYNPELSLEEVSLMYHYIMCSRKLDIERHCPNPCKKNPCIEENAVGCRAVDDTQALSLIRFNFDSLMNNLKHLFMKRHQCICKTGYFYNDTSGKCTLFEGPCKRETCSYKGECQEVQNPQFNAVKAVCNCQPAWTGEKCNIALDPCKNRELDLATYCGKDFRCLRDETSKFGFKCQCDAKEGYIPYGPNNPFCVDFDECYFENDICLNSGICVNTNGSYECMCHEAFTGRNCETMIRIGEANWSSWSPYSLCSTTCGMGHRISYRKCNIPYGCSGPDYKIQTCHVEKCKYDDSQIDNDENLRSRLNEQKEKQLLLLLNISVNMHEHSILDDQSVSINKKYKQDHEIFTSKSHSNNVIFFLIERAFFSIYVIFNI